MVQSNHFLNIPGKHVLEGTTKLIDIIVLAAVTLSSPIQSKLAPYLQKAASMFPSLKSMEDDDLSTRVKSKQGTLYCSF